MRVVRSTNREYQWIQVDMADSDDNSKQQLDEAARLPTRWQRGGKQRKSKAAWKLKHWFCNVVGSNCGRSFPHGPDMEYQATAGSSVVVNEDPAGDAAIKVQVVSTLLATFVANAGPEVALHAIKKRHVPAYIEVSKPERSSRPGLLKEGAYSVSCSADRACILAQGTPIQRSAFFRPRDTAGAVSDSLPSSINSFATLPMPVCLVPATVPVD